MTRLDAAAHFKFVLEWTLATDTLATDTLAVNREQATTAFTTKFVVPTVVDRDAAVVGARSEFSIVAAKPVESVSCFVSKDRFSASAFRWVNSLPGRHFRRNRAFGWVIQRRFRLFLAGKLSQGSAPKTSDSHLHMPDQRKRDYGFCGGNFSMGGWAVFAVHLPDTFRQSPCGSKW